MLLPHRRRGSAEGANDLVFDPLGGFYFTDLGRIPGARMDRGAIFYATTDGRAITEVAFPMVTPNEMGLSPDERTLSVTETEPARLWAFDIVEPWIVRKKPWPSLRGGPLVAGVGGYQRFDSPALDVDWRICAATLIKGGITVISPDGRGGANKASLRPRRHGLLNLPPLAGRCGCGNLSNQLR